MSQISKINLKTVANGLCSFCNMIFQTVKAFSAKPGVSLLLYERLLMKIQLLGIVDTICVDHVTIPDLNVPKMNKSISLSKSLEGCFDL